MRIVFKVAKIQPPPALRPYKALYLQQGKVSTGEL